ncbi:MAG: hypothetical protein V1871_01260 [Planctomycetota bacterium]
MANEEYLFTPKSKIFCHKSDFRSFECVGGQEALVMTNDKCQMTKPLGGALC